MGSIAYVQNKIATARNTCGCGSGREIAYAISRASPGGPGLAPSRAQRAKGRFVKGARKIASRFFGRSVRRWCAHKGIGAESPQDLHWQIRGLAAESPVFCPGAGKKCAMFSLVAALNATRFLYVKRKKARRKKNKEKVKIRLDNFYFCM
jgi:hypothetical protein